MAYNGFIHVETREKLMDFILWEEITPNGYSRDVVAPSGSLDYAVGDLIKADGTKATVAADIYGICLNNYKNSIGLTSSGQTSITLLVRDAEVKDTALNLGTMAAADVATALKAKGIILVATGK